MTEGGDMSLVLKATTAAELMTPNPISISDHATIINAASVLNNRELSALPVINEAGRPVGVISRADIVRRETSTREVPEIMTPTVFSVRAWFVWCKSSTGGTGRPSAG
jgi:CBS domain-containing protein